ncbi:hypothetical protein C0993_000748 [Termitomyces sp. T159_Od127]|nr:hypothetical protein C0993_000748 [Termitomyces sp. T159_Od127]
MFCFAKEFLIPPARQGSFSAMTGLGMIIQRLAFVASLWTILLTALSPTTKTLITLFAIHPLSSPSSLFTSPPTPPRRAVKVIKPPRREEEPKSAPTPPTIALFHDFANPPLSKRSAVAYTITRHVPDVLETQQKPAVSDGRGIKESLDIVPPNLPSPESSPRKPAVSDGRGIEEPPAIIPPTPPSDEALRTPAAPGGRGIAESSDVTTTPTTSNESTDEQVISNVVEEVGTSIAQVHDIEETVALAPDVSERRAPNT